MIAHLYLLAESFANNASYSYAEIEEKIKRLAEDVQLIDQHKQQNKRYTNYEDILPQVVLGEYTVEDLLYRSRELQKKGIDRDIISALASIIEKAATTTDTSAQVKQELLSRQDDENCHGMIAFHKIEGVDESFQVIYGIDGWYKFRRHFLGKYPKNADFFIDECSIYFPRLFFHEQNRTSIKTILHNCSQKIVYHLSALNDLLNNYEDTQLNRAQILEHFSKKAGLDEIASLEGNVSRKKYFTLSFRNNKGEMEAVCCEPHLKLCYNDYYPGDSSYSNDRRIYFHEGKAHIHEGKILIGHIGQHL